MNPSAKEFVPSWSAKEFVPKVAAACAPTEVKPAESIPVPKAAEPTSVKRRADLKPEVEENKTAESKSPQDDLEAELAEEIDAVMAAEAAQHDGREHVNMVFIGHVDAGKSTISGQLLIQMGMVDSRVIEKYEREAKEKNRESWYIAYIMDVSEDERVKGKTVETGRAYFVSDKKRYTILDAPGHKSYVPSMISGAAQADIAVLVISARKGEFETGFDRGGQTREHAMLVKTLGVTKLVIAVNKMDDPSVKWSEERFTGIKDKLEPFLKSCGFNTKKNVDFVPIAGLSGINIKDKVPKEVCPWYTGASLVELLDELPPIPRDPEGSVRIPVADKYKAKGYTIAFGKLETGTIKVGQVVVVMPVNQEAEIAMIEINDKSVSVATPGENLCVYLKGIEEANVLPGFVICDAVSPCPTVRSFVGKV
jgi:peptide chain release factor subunit 3